MLLKPKFTVSGYRGIWGQDLDEKIAYSYARAYAKDTPKVHKKILVGRDARQTGPEMLATVKKAFEDEGFSVDSAGIIPTPSILLLVKELDYDAGVIITASHNPKEYNGLKLVKGNGMFINQSEIDMLEHTRTLLKGEEVLSANTISPQREDKEKELSFRKIHLEKILKNIDVDLIRNKKYKVALDPINSAGSIIAQELLKELNCEVHVINAEQNGQFSHEPEPLVKNLSEISEATKTSASDIGFALDPDGDRLVLVDESGKILSEEYTLALAVKNVCDKNPSDVVINLSTSRMSDDVVNAFGHRAIKTKVGELNVVEKMLEINAVIGGEGNGGVIYPKINLARDGQE